MLCSALSVLFVGALLTMLFFPAQQERAAITALRARTASTAHMVELGVRIGLGLNQYAGVTEAMEWAKQDTDLAYIVVLDSAGGVFAEYNPGHVAVAADGSAGTVRTTGDLMHTAVPVRYEGRDYGELRLGMSLMRTKEQLAWDRWTIGFATLVVFLIGSVISGLLANLISAPIVRLRQIADRVAAGEYDLAVPSGGDDEIGALSGAFAVMVSRVRESVALLNTQADDLRVARDGALSATRTKSSFLANLSHEIRTPMNGILGLTELMLDTELSSYQRRSMGLVQSAGEELLTLLNDVLDFSKIEGEHLTLESTPFDLRYVVESTVSLLAVRIGDRAIELAADMAADVPPLVRGDPTRLRQVLTNLLGNAIKFTNAGEVVLSATRAPAPEGTVIVRFAVRDTGLGIPAEQLATIFQEFVQADASMTRKYGGTGLGLAISKRLVELMGGELTVTSEVGKGSEFAFAIELPVESARPPLATAANPITGMRMLVVDDNATNRRILREMLTFASVAVDEAPDADHALDLIRAAQREGAPYAVSITDVQMPGSDGFDLAAKVRSDPALSVTRILMLTSAVQRGDTERCRELGVEGYLTKPVSRSELLEMVATLVGHPPGREPTTRHMIAESRRRLHILLAEDNAINQEVAATMLRKRGHKVDLVSNGLEAVKAVARTRYDLVLMDVQMPEMDGFDATKVIRATTGGADLPIIALTAHAQTGERERCLANGMTDYLAKPFKPHDLFAMVEGFGEVRPPAAVEAVTDLPAPLAVLSTGTMDVESFRRDMREAGAEDAVDGILELFVQNVPQRIAALTAAVDAKDAPEIARAAHAFMSPSGQIGARGLAGLLRDVEQAARQGAVGQACAAFALVGPETDAVVLHLQTQTGGPRNG